jgi:hypothetical protein
LEDSECETPKAHAAVTHNFKEVSSILIKAGAKQTYKPVYRRDYSPPMIKEYDPHEDNAKTRAARRKEELKLRDRSIEVDKT